MKSLCLTLLVALMTLSTAAFAQTDAPKTDGPKSDAQKSFDTMKTLAGIWTAKLTVDPPLPDMNDKDMPGQVSMRVTSRGNALVHEMYAVGVPDDPTRYDHPLTMLYLDGNHLNLIHYCDAGNRPHMIARPSPDGKTVEFDFVDISGGMQCGHMHHAVFTVIDANHHAVRWPNMHREHKHIDAASHLQCKHLLE